MSLLNWNAVNNRRRNGTPSFSMDFVLGQFYSFEHAPMNAGAVCEWMLVITLSPNAVMKRKCDLSCHLSELEHMCSLQHSQLDAAWIFYSKGALIKPECPTLIKLRTAPQAIRAYILYVRFHCSVPAALSCVPLIGAIINKIWTVWNIHSQIARPSSLYLETLQPKGRTKRRCLIVCICVGESAVMWHSRIQNNRYFEMEKQTKSGQNHAVTVHGKIECAACNVKLSAAYGVRRRRVKKTSDAFRVFILVFGRILHRIWNRLVLLLFCINGKMWSMCLCEQCISFVGTRRCLHWREYWFERQLIRRRHEIEFSSKNKYVDAYSVWSAHTPPRIQSIVWCGIQCGGYICTWHGLGNEIEKNLQCSAIFRFAGTRFHSPFILYSIFWSTREWEQSKFEYILNSYVYSEREQ